MKIDNQFAIEYNRTREANQDKLFKRREILELLISNVPEFPKCDMIVTILVKNGALLKIGEARRVEYKFTNTPVHIATLSTCVFTLKDYWKNNSKRNNSKGNSEITGLTPITEEYCIKYLKERGYKVMKKITKFEEV